jgi:hypothetical protein
LHLLDNAHAAGVISNGVTKSGLERDKKALIAPDQLQILMFQYTG